MPQFGRGKPATGAFFDTDFATIDSVLTISLLYGLQAKNDCHVEIITMSRPNLAVAGFADLVERYYHGPGGNFSQLPPIGMRTEGAAGETSPAYTAPFEKKKVDGSPAFKNEVKSVIETADPVTLIRNYLQAQQDQNSFLILGGPATNLVAALAYPGIKPLIVAKVKYLVISAGSFAGGVDPRIKADIPAAKKLLAEWPTPIVVCGSEIGSAFPFPGAAIEHQFAEAMPDNPVPDAYRAYKAMPYDAASWNLAAALYAARPKENYFKVSAAGRITVDDEGKTTFAAADKGPHQYLIADPAQKEKIVTAYIELASTKPVVRRFRQPDAADNADTPPADGKTPPAAPPTKKK